MCRYILYYYLRPSVSIIYVTIMLPCNNNSGFKMLYKMYFYEIFHSCEKKNLVINLYFSREHIF